MERHIRHSADAPTIDTAAPHARRGATKPKAGRRRNGRHHASPTEVTARPADAAGNPFRKQDLAFQRAMKRAVARGREHPPMMGVHRDARPLDLRCTFTPVPHHSGCVSPASYCADLARNGDRACGAGTLWENATDV